MKRDIKKLKKLLEQVPDGPWSEHDGDVHDVNGHDVVWTFPNEGGGASSLEIAQYITLLNPVFIRKLLAEVEKCKSTK